VLANQIMNRTRERIGSASSNFAGQLAPADSDVARQLAKDPYVFDVLVLPIIRAVLRSDVRRQENLRLPAS